MSIVNNFRRLPLGKKLTVTMGAVFLLLYFALGFLFLFARNLPFDMSPAMKTGFGLILVAYASYRLVRLAGSLKGAEDNDSDAPDEGSVKH